MEDVPPDVDEPEDMLANHRIALVDDDERVRVSMDRAISRSGKWVLWFEAGSVEGALAWIETCLPEQWPAVWLIDLGLPDGTGLQVIEAVLRREPKTKVLVVSAFGDEHKVLDSIAAGACGYMLKGGDDEILDHIDSLANGGAPMSPAIARQMLNRLRSTYKPQESPPSTAFGAQPKRAYLTPKEEEILLLISRGYSYDDVGGTLGVSTNTVRYHVKHIYNKLGAKSKIEALHHARRLGLISPHEH